MHDNFGANWNTVKALIFARLKFSQFLRACCICKNLSLAKYIFFDDILSGQFVNFDTVKALIFARIKFSWFSRARRNHENLSLAKYFFFASNNNKKSEIFHLPKFNDLLHSYKLFLDNFLSFNLAFFLTTISIILYNYCFIFLEYKTIIQQSK